MSGPELWIVSGPNGAGKTTCVQMEPASQLIPAVKIFNPDNMTLEKIIAQGYQGFADCPIEVQNKLFIESANEVQERIEAAIENREHVGIETVLSTNKYHRLVERVKELNGSFFLLYISLHAPSVAISRVADRVAKRGHGIPDDKIEARFYRSLQNLNWYASRADVFWVLDNSGSVSDKPLPLKAMGINGRLAFLAEDTFPELNAALSPLV